MLQTCISEHQKLKMETAHHKLQLNLMSMQAEEESKRAAVEHDMVRREVDALRMAEHSRQARRELSSSADSMQSKYLQTKAWYDAAMDENDSLAQRLRVAKKVIQQKEDQTVGLMEERDVLLNRIRENREHFHMLCSPGGIFHGALTPKQQTQLSTTATQHHHHHSQPRSHATDDRQEGGLSALLQAMSQDHHHHSNNTSAPTTPKHQKAAGRRGSRHNRNAQSMSSLPSTPMRRAQRDPGLLPSIDLVPQTEPRMRYADRFDFDARAQKQDQEQGRKSRESTISADDEEVARQALMSVREERRDEPYGSQTATDRQGETPYGSQASQAATEMLRRQVDESQNRQSQGRQSKRKFSGDVQASPKRARQTERIGLGIH